MTQKPLSFFPAGSIPRRHSPSPVRPVSTATCLSFDYGQRHRAELAAAVRVAAAQRTAAHRTITLDLAQFGGSALTDTGIAVPVDGVKPGIPVTYVPARNTIMLSLALAWAEVLEARDIFVGINAVDYSGYPDCRPEYLAAFQTMANLATEGRRRGAATRHPCAADRPLESLDHPPWQFSRCRLRAHRVLLPGRRRRPRLRRLRLLPPAPGRLRGGRHP